MFCTQCFFEKKQQNVKNKIGIIDSVADGCCQDEAFDPTKIKVKEWKIWNSNEGCYKKENIKIERIDHISQIFLNNDNMFVANDNGGAMGAAAATAAAMNDDSLYSPGLNAKLNLNLNVNSNSNQNMIHNLQINDRNNNISSNGNNHPKNEESHNDDRLEINEQKMTENNVCFALFCFVTCCVICVRVCVYFGCTLAESGILCVYVFCLHCFVCSEGCKGSVV